MEDVKKLVGDRIRQLRKGMGLSQEKLGDKSDLHYTHIGAIERGEKNWSIDTLVKVARGLDVTINDLLVLPSKPEDTTKLRRVIIAEINESSPVTLRMLAEVVRCVKSLEENKTIRR